MATFEPDPDAPSPVFGITPERLAKTQAAIDDLAGTLNAKADNLEARMKETREAIVRLRLERDVALRTVVLAIDREELATSALKKVRELLRAIPGAAFVITGTGRVDRIVRVIDETLRDLDLTAAHEKKSDA
jgi:outer membrane receptor for Fe3+-dicitrate